MTDDEDITGADDGESIADDNAGSLRASVSASLNSVLTAIRESGWQPTHEVKAALQQHRQVLSPVLDFALEAPSRVKTPQTLEEIRRAQERDREQELRTKRREGEFSLRPDERACGEEEKPLPIASRPKTGDNEPRGYKFEPELGVLIEKSVCDAWSGDTTPAAPPPDSELLRWSRAATAVVTALVPLIESVDAALASVRSGGAADRWRVLALPALDEVEAAQRALCRGWRQSLESYFQVVAIGKSEAKEREAREKPGTTYAIADREQPRADEIVATIKRVARATAVASPRHIVNRPRILADVEDRYVWACEAAEALGKEPPLPADFPPHFDPRIIEYLMTMVRTGAGGPGGGYTAQKATERAEAWARDPNPEQRITEDELQHVRAKSRRKKRSDG